MILETFKFNPGGHRKRKKNSTIVDKNIKILVVKLFLKIFLA